MDLEISPEFKSPEPRKSYQPGLRLHIINLAYAKHNSKTRVEDIKIESRGYYQFSKGNSFRSFMWSFAFDNRH